MNEFNISSVEKLQVLDQSGNLSYGAQQAFFSSFWKRQSGCGPTAGANLVLYEKRKDLRDENSVDIKKVRQLMNRMWKYITPRMMGVHVASIFTQGIEDYLKDHHLKFKVKELIIAKAIEKRVSLEEVQTFITQALQKNHLVAFLNRHNGLELNLDRWHWVVITAIQFDENQCRVEILDQGKKIMIDLKVWLASTPDCGAFICLDA